MIVGKYGIEIIIKEADTEDNGGVEKSLAAAAARRGVARFWS